MKRNIKKSYKRIAFALSLCLLVIWGILGTGTSLAWFTDTTPKIKNIFHFAEFDLEVSHLLDNGEWEIVDEQTKIFDEEALYEPGYVQVVYLKVKNKGTRDFKFYSSVNVNDCTVATNVFGSSFFLQDYLKFGVTVNYNENDMLNGVSDREVAKELAYMPLHNYHTDTAVLKPQNEAYIALIVRMPEEVDNVANYRGDVKPNVELGITVKATQTNMPEE